MVLLNTSFMVTCCFKTQKVQRLNTFFTKHNGNRSRPMQYKTTKFQLIFLKALTSHAMFDPVSWLTALFIDETMKAAVYSVDMISQCLLKPWPHVPKYTAETKKVKQCKRNDVAIQQSHVQNHWGQQLFDLMHMQSQITK